MYSVSLRSILGRTHCVGSTETGRMWRNSAGNKNRPVQFGLISNALRSSNSHGEIFKKKQQQHRSHRKSWESFMCVKWYVIKFRIFHSIPIAHIRTNGWVYSTSWCICPLINWLRQMCRLKPNVCLPQKPYTDSMHTKKRPLKHGLTIICSIKMFFL